MLHATEMGLPGAASSEEVRAFQSGFQADIRRSRSGIHGLFASVHGWFYLLTFLGCATIGHILFRPSTRDQELTRALADTYPHVPEMALHKYLELQEYTRCEFRGRGFDFGAGDGAVGGILMRSMDKARLHGIDVADGASSAKQNGYIGYTVCDIERTPLPAASFDFGISVCVLEHVENLRAAIAEAARLLRSGGQFALSAPLPQFRSATLGYRLCRALGFKEAARRYAAYRDLHASHYNYLGPAEWEDLLREHGFEVTASRAFFSRRQMLIYELFNYPTHVPRLYPTYHIAKTLRRYPPLRRLARRATEFLLAAAATRDESSEIESNTHLFLLATKTGR